MLHRAYLLTLSLGLMLAVISRREAALSGSYQSGVVKHYTPALMEKVLRVRQRQGLIQDIPTGVVGYASRPSCQTIGDTFYLSVYNPQKRIWGTPELYLQVDCAQYRDYHRQVAEGLVAELDYKSAARNGFVRDGKTRARVVVGRAR